MDELGQCPASATPRLLRRANAEELVMPLAREQCEAPLSDRPRLMLRPGSDILAVWRPLFPRATPRQLETTLRTGNYDWKLRFTLETGLSGNIIIIICCRSR
jgi:hypothetical protein